jgi:hypothetical protein
MKIVAFVLAALLAVPAMATNNRPPDNRPPDKQKQGQTQGQTQGQVQGQTQSQIASSSAQSGSTSSSSIGDVNAAGGAGGDAASSADNSITFEASKTYKHTPDVSLGGIFPSSSCMGVANLGVSGVGFGVGGGKSYVDKECDKRETARSFGALGYATEALVILCSTEAAQVLDSCPRAAVAPPAVACDAPAPSCPDPEKVVEQRKQIGAVTSK